MKRRCLSGALCLTLILGLPAPALAREGEGVQYDRVGDVYNDRLSGGYAVAEKDGKYATVWVDNWAFSDPYAEGVPLGTYAYMDGFRGNVCIVGTGGPHTTADGVRLPAEKFGLMGMESSFELVLPLEYDYIWPYADGYLPVLKDGKTALVRPDGTVAVPFQAIELTAAGGTYRRPTPADFGLGEIPDPDTSAAPDLQVTWMPGYDLSWSTGVSTGGLVTAVDRDTGFYGVLDSAGNEVVPCTFKSIAGYNEWQDYAQIIQDDFDAPVSLFDAQGRKVDTPYRFIRYFYGGLNCVTDAETLKRGYIDEDWDLVIPCIYDGDADFEDGDYVVTSKDGVSGLLDKKGNFTIPAGWDGVEALADGGRLVVVKKGDDVALIQRESGKVVIPTGTYDYINTWSGRDYGLLEVGKTATTAQGGNTTLTGVVDLEGNVVIPVQYRNLAFWEADYVFSGLCFLVMDDSGQWGLLDREGKELLPCRYYIDLGGHMGPAGPSIYDVLKELYPDAEDPRDEPYLIFDEGLTSMGAEGTDGSWHIGFMDEAGEMVVPPLFDQVVNGFCNGWCIVCKDGVYGLVKSPLNRDKVSDWAADEVAEARERGLVTERTGTYLTYPVTRLQFAELAVNLAEQATGKALVPAAEGRFSDTADLTARKAAAAGIVTGTGDGAAFRPNDLITREQIAVMLERTLRLVDPACTPSTADLSGYSDAGKVSGWAREAVEALAASGVMKGSSDTTLSPLDDTTVEQAILLILRAAGTAGAEQEPYVAWLDLPAGPEQAQACKVIREGEAYALTDGDGKVLVPAGTYDHIGQPVGGLLAARRTERVEPYGDPAYGLRDTRERWGFLDTFGNVAAPLEYDRVWETDAALIPVQKGTGCSGIGFLDRTGREVVPCAFVTSELTLHGGMYVGTPSPDFLGVGVNEDGTVASLMGNWQSGYTPVRGEHGLWGYADKEGRLVTEQVFESVSAPSAEGLVLVKQGGRYGLLHLF